MNGIVRTCDRLSRLHHYCCATSSSSSTKARVVRCEGSTPLVPFPPSPEQRTLPWLVRVWLAPVGADSSTPLGALELRRAALPPRGEEVPIIAWLFLLLPLPADVACILPVGDVLLHSAMSPIIVFSPAPCFLLSDSIPPPSPFVATAVAPSAVAGRLRRGRWVASLSPLLSPCPSLPPHGICWGCFGGDSAMGLA